MAKNQEKNIIIDAQGLAHDPDLENPVKTKDIEGIRKLFADFGIDSTFVKEVGKPLLRELATGMVRDKLGLKKSELRPKSKAYQISTFMKEMGWSLIAMGAAVMLLSIGFKLLLRFLGL